MRENEAIEEFKEGLGLLRSGQARAALRHLRKAVTLNARNPFYLSYMGLALGAAEGDWDQAEDLCFTALRMTRNRPELYLNLAEVYRRAGKKEDAVWILMSGLEVTKRDARLQHALSQLGIRRPPLLAFLDRKNFLNRHLGRLRSRLSTAQRKRA